MHFPSGWISVRLRSQHWPATVLWNLLGHASRNKTTKDPAMLQGRLHYYSAPGLAPHVGHETPAGVHGLPCVHQGRLAENIILQETMPCP